VKSVVSPQVFSMFPDYIRGIIIARNIDNHGENAQLLEWLRQEEEQATRDVSLQDIKSHPRIANWRQAYQKFGSNPNKFYPSVESLCRRARRGDQLPYINTAVALFNYFSLKHVLPSGADDIDSVHESLLLTTARGDEPFTPFNSATTEFPDPGEVIYYDGASVMCRRWNWRQGDQTKLTPDTKNIVINLDCLPPVTHEEAGTLTIELVSLVHQFCHGEVRYDLISRDRNEVEI
jgi:DNA/RNA-binding domain of Phe-tRNA-synthetase-like protein